MSEKIKIRFLKKSWPAEGVPELLKEVKKHISQNFEEIAGLKNRIAQFSPAQEQTWSDLYELSSKDFIQQNTPSQDPRTTFKTNRWLFTNGSVLEINRQKKQLTWTSDSDYHSDDVLNFLSLLSDHLGYEEGLIATHTIIKNGAKSITRLGYTHRRRQFINYLTRRK